MAPPLPSDLQITAAEDQLEIPALIDRWKRKLAALATLELEDHGAAVGAVLAAAVASGQRGLEGVPAGPLSRFEHLLGLLERVVALDRLVPRRDPPGNAPAEEPAP
jgi:hypothetical protein